MVTIKFFVTDFASHNVWATGYQRATWKENAPPHDIRLEFIPANRWKYRMISGCSNLVEKISVDDEILVFDAMIDISVIVALLGKRRQLHHLPKILLYFHENQLTTPFTAQDRDRQKATTWHYGLSHWRSLMVADGVLFNSRSHFEAFSLELPRLINEQSPRDIVEDELRSCREILASKCAVLQPGLGLDALLVSPDRIGDDSNVFIDSNGNRVPVILWNARMEEDKNPSQFIEILQRAQERVRFKVICLGTDPSNGQIWIEGLKSEFASVLLHVGWCSNREEYATWLRRASIVISTAEHETFGISIIESAFCGVLPLLPQKTKLSYPEIFSGLGNAMFYTGLDEAVAKLVGLASIVTNIESHHNERCLVQRAVEHFDWSRMCLRYDTMFSLVAKGGSIKDAVAAAIEGSAKVEVDASKYMKLSCDDQISVKKSRLDRYMEITDPMDTKIQLYRPKSLRDHKIFNKQVSMLRGQGFEPALHGGRRAISRMMEAILLKNAKITPLSFLTTKELADSIFESLPVARYHGEFPPIYIAAQAMLDEIRGQKLNHGDAVLAMIHFPQESSLAEIIAKPPILILDNVRNAENVGTILRSAFCLGITSIIATATSWSALRDTRAARSSMGTLYYHNYLKVSNSSTLVETFRTIQASGITLYGIEIDDRSRPISAHGNGRQYALVMGNEDVGLSPQASAACDVLLEIPQASGDSLNVAVAASISMQVLGSKTESQHDGLAACP